MDVTVTIAPAEGPVAVADAKAQLAIDFGDDDALVSSLLAVATSLCELWTGRAFVERTVTVTALAPVGEQTVAVPVAPLQSVGTASYYRDGSLVVLPSDEWRVKPRTSWFGHVRPELYRSWPAMDHREDALVLTDVVVGYGTAGDVPEALRHAVMALAGHLYNHREATTAVTGLKETPMSVSALLAPYRVIPHGGGFIT